jgi:hypothetical protein
VIEGFEPDPNILALHFLPLSWLSTASVRSATALVLQT